MRKEAIIIRGKPRRWYLYLPHTESADLHSYHVKVNSLFPSSIPSTFYGKLCLVSTCNQLTKTEFFFFSFLSNDENTTNREEKGSAMSLTFVKGVTYIGK